MEAGNGQVEVWFIAEITDDGIAVAATGNVCEVEVPDFKTKQLVGGDTHGTVIPAEAWASAPSTQLIVEIDERRPGSALRVPVTPMLLGASIPDPMGEWPVKQPKCVIGGP